MNYKDEMKSLKRYEIYEIEEAYKKLKEIKENIKIPKKIYRYRPLNIYTIDELMNEHVFLSYPNIDDIFDTTIVNNGKEAEGILAAYHFAKYFKDKDPKMNESFKFYTEFFEELNNKLRESMRIACFTESNTNVPMWQYYAEKIVQNKSALHIGDNFRCDYEMPRKFIMCSVLKMEEWKFEKEWRIIAFDDERLQKNPYVKLEINAIYFGISTPQPIKNVIKGLLNKKISLYEMRKDLTGLEEYKIV